MCIKDAFSSCFWDILLSIVLVQCFLLKFHSSTLQTLPHSTGKLFGPVVFPFCMFMSLFNHFACDLRNVIHFYWLVIDLPSLEYSSLIRFFGNTHAISPGSLYDYIFYEKLLHIHVITRTIVSLSDFIMML